MEYPVLLMPWPPRSSELRRIDWADYIADPKVGLLVDPDTGEPYADVVSVRLQVLAPPPVNIRVDGATGEAVTMKLADFLTAETQRQDLGRATWAEVLGFDIEHQPPPLALDDHASGLLPDFERVKRFLFETLEEGPISELEIIGRAADSGISPATLREVKDRLRIASVMDPDAEYPRTLWRLRMSQSFKLKRRRTPDPRR